MSEENKELWEWFEKKFGEDAMNRFYCYEVNELIKEVKHRAKCEKMEKIREELEEMEKKLGGIEKKIDWLIEYLGLGMYNYQAKITYNIATGEEKPQEVDR